MQFLKNHWRIFIPITIMVIVFLFSASPSALSDATSEPVANFLGLPNGLTRKIAHFVLYASLGASLNYFFRTLGKFTSAFNFFVSLAISVIYACTDEIHQTFIPGRAGLLSDVGLDSIAAFTGIVIFAALYYCTRTPAQKKSRKAQEAKIWKNNSKLIKKLFHS